jgi:hypothetical protein
MDAKINPEMLAMFTQFMQAQAALTAPAPTPAKVETKPTMLVIVKRDAKGDVLENIADCRQPTAEEFSKVGQYSRMWAKAMMAGKPLEEGIVKISKNGAISILVDVDYVTAGKMRQIIKTAPDVRLKAWKAYSESAKRVTGITIGGLAQAIRTLTAAPGQAPITFKAKVEALMKEPISADEKIKRISEWLEDGRKTEAAPAVVEAAPAAPAKKPSRKKA